MISEAIFGGFQKNKNTTEIGKAVNSGKLRKNAPPPIQKGGCWNGCKGVSPSVMRKTCVLLKTQ